MTAVDMASSGAAPRVMFVVLPCWDDSSSLNPSGQDPGLGHAPTNPIFLTDRYLR